MKRFITFFLVLSLICVSVVGCSMQAPTTTNTTKESTVDTSSATTTSETQKEEIIIGYSPLSMEMEYFQNVKIGMEMAAKELGVKMIYNDPQMDASKQATGVEEMITAGAKGVIICSIDPAAAESAANYAHDKGVKVVSHVSTFKGADVYVGLKEYEFGFTIGDALGKHIKDNMNGEANVAVLDADSLGEGLLQRMKGFTDGISQNAPNAKFVARITAFSEEAALNGVETILTEHPEVNVIICANDPGAAGSISAIESKGMSGKVIIAAVGSEKRQCENILSGKVLFGVDPNPFDCGKLMVEAALKAINGESVEKDIFVTTSLVTKENAQSLIDMMNAQ